MGSELIPSDWLLADATTRMSRALLRAARSDALLQDRIDCADLALRIGQSGMAAMLKGVITLELGTSQRALTVLGKIGMDGVEQGSSPPSEQAARGFSVDLAIAELRRLMRLSPRLGLRPDSLDASLPAAIAMGAQPASGLDPRVVLLSQSVAATLRRVPVAARDGTLGELLRGLADDILKLAPIRIDEHVDLEVADLAALFALERTRRFLLTNVDLLGARSSIGDLFEEAGRLEPGALGPYFSNLWLLLRDTRDVFALIDVAADGKSDFDTIECWSVLLSAYLPSRHLESMAGEFGDRGMTRGLSAILLKIARESATSHPHDVARAVRDASLDIDAIGLGEQAQHLLALWRRTDPTEWRLLGAIRGQAGDRAGAEAAFDRALEMRPEDTTTLDLMAAMAVDQHVPFEGQAGARRRLRQARLAAFRGPS